MNRKNKQRTVPKIVFFLAPAFALMFGLGCAYGTVVTVRAEIAGAARSQREHLEAAAMGRAATEAYRNSAGAAKIFRTK